MSEILEQLELNSTFFYQFALFFVVFLFLSSVYFKPFLKLIQLRYKRTIEDKEAAEKLFLQAQTKLSEYEKRISDERNKIRSETDQLMLKAKAQEAEILAHAREEAKKLTQEAMANIDKQKDALKTKLQGEIETLATQVSEKLMLRKG